MGKEQGRNCMNNNLSLEARMLCVNRELITRITHLESKLLFWRVLAVGMTVVCLVLTALKCR